MLVGARQIFLFARGHALSLADLAERRLRRFGLDIVPLDGENRSVAERLALMRADDLLLVFAFRARSKSLNVILTHATRLGCPTLLLADLSAATACPPMTLTLAAPRGRSGDEFQTLTVPMAVLNALVLTIAGRHEAVTQGALETAAMLIKELDQ
jgi:DNA-binding MurR/RpiR family transcriptional regulator